MEDRELHDQECRLILLAIVHHPQYAKRAIDKITEAIAAGHDMTDFLNMLIRLSEPPPPPPPEPPPEPSYKRKHWEAEEKARNTAWLNEGLTPEQIAAKFHERSAESIRDAVIAGYLTPKVSPINVKMQQAQLRMHERRRKLKEAEQAPSKQLNFAAELAGLVVKH